MSALPLVRLTVLKDLASQDSLTPRKNPSLREVKEENQLSHSSQIKYKQCEVKPKTIQSQSQTEFQLTLKHLDMLERFHCYLKQRMTQQVQTKEEETPLKNEVYLTQSEKSQSVQDQIVIKWRQVRNLAKINRMRKKQQALGLKEQSNSPH